MRSARILSRLPTASPRVWGYAGPASSLRKSDHAQPEPFCNPAAISPSPFAATFRRLRDATSKVESGFDQRFVRDRGFGVLRVRRADVPFPTLSFASMNSL